MRDTVRADFGLEVFTHALATPDTWPPQAWSHDRAAWTVEAKFIVNDYGLRNRFAIITETPGQPTFERRIYAQYAYLVALLEYTSAHAAEMQAVAKKADDDTVAAVMARRGGAARSPTSSTASTDRPARSICSPIAPTSRLYKPGTSLMGTKPGTASGPPDVCPAWTTSPSPWARARPRCRARTCCRRAWRRSPPSCAPTTSASPRSTTPAKVQGEQFTIDRMYTVRRAGYDMTTLDGSFSPVVTKEFPAGSFLVDMAQPMANAAFYYLEPQARDGFVGWGVMDDALRALGRSGTAGRVSDLQGATAAVAPRAAHDQVGAGAAGSSPAASDDRTSERTRTAKPCICDASSGRCSRHLGRRQPSC